MNSCSQKSQSDAAYGAAEGFQSAQAQSYASLRAYYRGLIEGLVHQLYCGEGRQRVHQIETGDPEAVYQLTKKACVFLTFDEHGKGSGEQAYAKGPATVNDLTNVAAQLPPAQFFLNPQH